VLKRLHDQKAGSDFLFNVYDTTYCTLLWDTELKGFIRKVEPHGFTLLDLGLAQHHLKTFRKGDPVLLPMHGKMCGQTIKGSSRFVLSLVNFPWMIAPKDQFPIILTPRVHEPNHHR
jgi:hypothetical protein